MKVDTETWKDAGRALISMVLVLGVALIACTQ